MEKYLQMINLYSLKIFIININLKKYYILKS